MIGMRDQLHDHLAGTLSPRRIVHSGAIGNPADGYSRDVTAFLPKENL